MKLVFEEVTIRRGGRTVVRDIDLTVEPGTVLGLVGPNGSGKSTLLRTVYRAATPIHGRILVGEDDLHRLPVRQAARSVAAMTQDNPGEFDLTVLDMVLLGRTPHAGGPSTNARDVDIAAAAIDRVGASDWVNRSFTTLSGGQKQRVLLARALAQQAPILVLDEPTNHLDVTQRIAVMETVESLEVTTVIATHDLDLAVQYCDQVAVLEHGTLRAHGKPADVLTAALLQDVFGIDAAFSAHPTTGRTHLLIAGIHRKEPRLQ